MEQIKYWKSILVNGQHKLVKSKLSYICLIYLQIRVLCLHLEKPDLLKIFPVNFGLKMIYLYLFHVEMNIVLL